MKSCEECEPTESMLIDTIYTLLPFMCICSVVEQTWTTWILSSCWRCTWLRRTQHDVSLVKLLVYRWRKSGFISWTKQDGPDKYGQPMCIKTINAGCCWESSDHRIENNFITIDRPSDKQPCGQQFVRRHHSLPKSIGVPLKTPGSFSKIWETRSRYRLFWVSVQADILPTRLGANIDSRRFIKIPTTTNTTVVWLISRGLSHKGRLDGNGGVDGEHPSYFMVRMRTC